MCICAISFPNCSYLSFDEGILATIAILTAIVVSIHVVDYFRIKELDEKQKRLEQEQQELKKFHTEFNNNLWLIKGISLTTSEPFLAFWCFCKAFESGLECNDAVLCDKSINNMSQVINYLKKPNSPNNTNKNGWEKIEYFISNQKKSLLDKKLYPIWEIKFSQQLEEIKNILDRIKKQ